MLRSVNKNPVHTFYGGLLIAFIFLATSCSGPGSPTIEQPLSSTPPAQITDFPAPVPQFSPGQHLRFERISLEQGLSQSTVFSMLQDSQGFMWFGTEYGLNKYDGYTFTVYKHDPEEPNSLSGNWVSALLEDDSGTLWIGTSDGGLNRYDRKLDQFTHYRNDPENPSSLSDDEITAIHQDGDGVLWIGTGGGGLDRVALSEAEGSDQENERFDHYQHDPDDPISLSSNAVSVIYEDREGMLWVGTEEGGLNAFERENERWWHYATDPSDPHSLSHNQITAISEDQSGALWVGTGGGGLSRLDLSKAEGFDPENERFNLYQHDPDDPESLSSDDIEAIYLDREGVLWIGTYSGGLNRFEPEKETFAHYQNTPSDPKSLSSNTVLSIFQDLEGVLWFGTIGGGVNKLEAGWKNFALYQNDPDNPKSLGDNMVRAFYEDREGNLWIGTMFGGVDRFDRETGNWRHYRNDPDGPGSLSNNFVSAIYRDSSDTLWIGTASGLDRYDPETEAFTRYQADTADTPGSLSNNVRTIYEGQEGDFWIGTKGGLYRFNRQEESWDHIYYYDPGDPHGPSDNWVFTFLEDRAGRIWVGTLGGGLYHFDPDMEKFRHYQSDPGDTNSLSNNVVVSIVQDREGTLWVGTGGGLDKFNPATETFTHYREKDGMLNDNVYCIVEDGGGHLWLSTNNGLSRFDPQRETFRNYDVTDGLQSNEFNSIACLMSNSEEMFFGGINGFNTFFPDKIMENPTIPPVVLTSLVHGSEQVNFSHTVDSVNEITLMWPEDSFEFEFAALSYAQPEKNQYAYYLEGFEETWNEVSTRRYGQYTHLPGGTYTLRGKGSNNDGVWNEGGALLKITVVPPFWATWWFRGIVLLVLVGVVVGGFRLRVWQLEVRGHELETQVISRTKELAALNVVASVMSRSLDLKHVLTNALDKTLEVMEIEAGGIYLFQEDAQTLTIAAHKSLSAPFIAEIDNLKMGEGFSGHVAQTGEPLVVQDLSTDPRLTRSAVKESGFHSLAITPLVSRGQVLGTLFVVTLGHRDFSQQDIELLTSIGGQIGVAVENAHLYEQAQQVAVVEERQRLARELHDSVTQSLHSSTLLAEAGQRLAGSGDIERARGYLIRLGEISQQALKEMRLLVYELRPLALRGVGLVGALQQRLDAVERRSGVEVQLSIEEEIELPAVIEEELFRIAMEALNNALKHSNPTRVKVVLSKEEQRETPCVELSIIDDGIGFDPDSKEGEGGLGLISMKERIDKLGGDLAIISKLGEGTQVKACVDLKGSQNSLDAQEV